MNTAAILLAYSLVIGLPNGDSFVVDSGMSREDCGERIRAGGFAGGAAAYTPDGQLVRKFGPDELTYICEPETPSGD